MAVDRSTRGEGGRFDGSKALTKAEPPKPAPKVPFAQTTLASAGAGANRKLDSAISAFEQLAAPAPQDGIPDFPDVDTPYRLSPSRAADYRNCPLRYRYLTIDKFPEPKTPEPVRGTLVHSVLEKMFDLPENQRTPSRARKMMVGEWDSMLAENPEYQDLMDETGSEGWLGGAQKLLDTYFKMEDPKRINPARQELKTTFKLNDDVTLLGFIDRVDVAPKTGDIRILDYKTGKSPKLGYEQKSLFQLKFYALALKKATGKTPKMLQLMYLGDGRSIRYEPTDADLVQTEKEIGALWGKIKESIDSGEFKPRKSGLCAYCNFKDKCPEYGGTIPPMPGK